MEGCSDCSPVPYKVKKTKSSSQLQESSCLSELWKSLHTFESKLPTIEAEDRSTGLPHPYFSGLEFAWVFVHVSKIFLYRTLEGTNTSTNRSRLSSRFKVAKDVALLMGILFERGIEAARVVEGSLLAAKTDLGSLNTLGVGIISMPPSLTTCSLFFLSFC